MNTAGIDLGGTKIETQVFAPDWALLDTRRVATPRDYDALVATLADQIRWAEQVGGAGLPVGIGAAGLINPATGLALTANLPAMGRPLPSDIVTAAGRPVTYINDCRAMILSEAVFGAGRGMPSVAGLIIGTGVGGGIAIDSRLVSGRSGAGGEVGHIAASAHIVQCYGLPVVACGCGRCGCIETLISGAGIGRIAQVVTGRVMSAFDIADLRESDPNVGKVWDIWCELIADLLLTITLTVDPACIVLGGGLSRIDGVADDLTRALGAAQFDGFDVPRIVLAQGGDTSGARGAAYAATMDD